MNWVLRAVSKKRRSHARPSPYANALLAALLIVTSLTVATIVNRTRPASATLPLTGLTQTAIGGEIGCGLDALGVAYCWGFESNPKGDGTTYEAPRPVLVSTDKRFVSIGAGFESACALATDNSVWCWGKNTKGQLGDGTTTTRATPVQAQLSAGGYVSVDELDVGGFHACGRTSAGGGAVLGLR